MWCDFRLSIGCQHVKRLWFLRRTTLVSCSTGFRASLCSSFLWVPIGNAIFNFKSISRSTSSTGPAANSNSMQGSLPRQLSLIIVDATLLIVRSSLDAQGSVTAWRRIHQCFGEEPKDLRNGEESFICEISTVNVLASGGHRSGIQMMWKFLPTNWLRSRTSERHYWTCIANSEAHPMTLLLMYP